MLFWTAVLINMTPLILTCVSLGKYFYLSEPGFLLCEIMNVVWMISKISLDCKLVSVSYKEGKLRTIGLV